MLKVLEEFENTNFVCQLGDHHLRSIPISKEFLDFCGDTTDDRGIVSDLTVDNASPIWTHFKNSKYIAILREPNELKNELEFTNQQHLQERFVPHSDSGLPDGVWMRPAIKADEEYIFQCEMETLDDKYKNDLKVINEIRKDARDSVKKTRIICFTNENNKPQTIGLLTAYERDDSENPGQLYWYIGEIYLNPDFRGKGIGKAVLEKEIEQHPWISLDVSKKNKHAIELYLSLGFKIISENEDGYRMDLKKETIQEGAWNDIKRGVNPWSKKMWFHV
jgi:ribosomal protein S18 acetylase RimI-like enzyme